MNWLWDIQGGATLGIIWAIMALGLYLTYRVLNYADMTVDGSLALGGAISAVYITAIIVVIALVAPTVKSAAAVKNVKEGQ